MANNAHFVDLRDETSSLDIEEIDLTQVDSDYDDGPAPPLPPDDDDDEPGAKRPRVADAVKQGDAPAGNTKIRSRAWFFTINNPEDHGFPTPDAVTQMFEDLKMTKILFQRERGANGTEHYQGCVYFENDLRFDTLKQLNGAVHWEKCHDWRAAVNYCQKSDTRIAGPWNRNMKDAIKPVPWYILPYDKMHGWQKGIVEMCQAKCGDDRKIFWFWEPNGNVGKTALAKHLCFYFGAIMVGGKEADMKFAIAERLDKGHAVPIVIVDITRSLEHYVSYSGIEAIKNGFFFTSKYKSGQVLFDPPHVIVFANFEPEQFKLSEDRLVVKRIR